MGRSTTAEAAVKSFVCTSIPLKAGHTPQHLDGWSDAVNSWLAEGPHAGSEAEAYMASLSSARSQLLKLLQAPSSSAAEVTAAQNKYLGLLVEISAVEKQVKQAEGGAAAAVLRSTWHDAILPLQPFKAEGTSSSGSSGSGTNQPGSKWFGAAARKKAAAAAAAAASSSSSSGAAAASAPASGYAYEAANTLLSVATWKLVKASSIIMASGAAGVEAGDAMDAYQLYCQAAGHLDQIRRQLLPQLVVAGEGGSKNTKQSAASGGDLQRELLSALHLFALAEAQNLMLQRAVALNYQGSTLAPMATDTAMLFSQAYEAIEATAKTLRLPWIYLPPLDTQPTAAVTGGTSSSSSTSSTAQGSSSSGPAKNSRMAGFERLLCAELPTDTWPLEALPLLQLAAYVQYQVGHCYALASVCAAEMALSSNQAGQAVALAQLGTNVCEQLQDIGFEQGGLIDPCGALGVCDSSRRLALQATLEQKAAYVLRRCLRENRTIYLQYVPEQPSALPWPQRSAQPEIFRLPEPKGTLTAETAQGLATVTAVGSLSDFSQPAAAASAVSANAATQQAAAAVVGGEGEAAAAAAGVDEEEPGPLLVYSSKARGVRGAARQQPVVVEHNSLAALAEETAAAVQEAQSAAARLARLQEQQQQDQKKQEQEQEDDDAVSVLSFQLQAMSLVDDSEAGGCTSPRRNSKSSRHAHYQMPQAYLQAKADAQAQARADVYDSSTPSSGSASPDAHMAVEPVFGPAATAAVSDTTLLSGSAAAAGQQAVVAASEDLLSSTASSKGKQAAAGDDDSPSAAATQPQSYTLASVKDVSAVGADEEDSSLGGPSSSRSSRGEPAAAVGGATGKVVGVSWRESDAGSSEWGEDEDEDGNEVGGLGGFFRGLFGCCAAPTGRTTLYDSEDESDYGGSDSEEEEQEEEDDWGKKGASKQRQQQLWEAQQQQQQQQQRVG